MISSLIQTLMILLFTSVLFACGGGESTSAPTSTQSETTFDLGKYVSLTTGTSYTLNFTGSDTTGATYTGTDQCNVVGITTFEGKNVIQRNHVLNLMKNGAGVIAAGIVSEFYNTDRTLYKEVYSNGIVNTSTNIFVLPLTVQPGNFAGQSISSSYGTCTTQTWQVNDAGNSTASIMITTTTNQKKSGVDTLIITTTGALLSLKQVLYDFPSVGVTTTLNGVMN